MTEHIAELRQHLGELEDLRNASGVLSWDQLTMMPSRGGPSRAEALATLERVSHEKFISAYTGRLLEAAAADALDGGARPTPTTRDWCRSPSGAGTKQRRVPTELAADLARAGSIGQEAWVQARQRL